MAVSETDRELLECYLDDELSLAQADELRERMVGEPALAAELEQLRQARTIRSQVWRTMEPTQHEAEQFAWRVRGKLRGGYRWQQWWGQLRIAGAAAACILIGIMVGRAADDLGRPIGVPADGAFLVDAAAAQQNPQQNSTQPIYRVSLTDPTGRLVAVQTFSSVSEARQFAQDVNQWQAKHRQLQSGNVRLVADEF
jgi:anti-sigma factor RsiW